jgi:hypothetical protein
MVFLTLPSLMICGLGEPELSSPLWLGNVRVAVSPFMVSSPGSAPRFLVHPTGTCRESNRQSISEP